MRSINNEFGIEERYRQTDFRKTLSDPVDPIGRRLGYLLKLGCEQENLYPALRGTNGAHRYFVERNLRWWQDNTNGDSSGGERPTRNMVSSQIACVNFLLPLIRIPRALLAVLQALDDDIDSVVEIESEGTSSPVEFEWIGVDHALEGPTIRTRGKLSTSVDAFMVVRSTTGHRRAYLIEWKYVESYSTKYLGDGKSGDTRRSRYENLYTSSPSFNKRVPFDAWLFEPFYQILRLRLLADRMIQKRELEISEAKLVVVLPDGNRAYHEHVTSPWLKQHYPNQTVSEIVSKTFIDPNNSYVSISPTNLAASVRQSCGTMVDSWSSYLRGRYGW